jgi:hypothetical protein
VIEWTSAIRGLNRAVDIAGKVITATPPNNSDRAGMLSNLGAMLEL